MKNGLGKMLAGRVAGAVLFVAAAVVIIWYWRLEPTARAAMWATARGVLVWLGFVAVLPWATVFVPWRVVRIDSNYASAGMLAGYLAVDVAFALYLTGGGFGEGWQGVAMIVGFLIAFVYNWAACEHIAERSQDRP